MTLLLWTCLS